MVQTNSKTGTINPEKGRSCLYFFVWRLQQFRQLFAEKEIMYHLIQL